MSDIDFLYQSFGDVSFPTRAGEVADGQLFSAFDPGRDRLLALFRTAIVQELTAAWNVARAGTILAAVAPVADTIYQVPTRALLRETKLGFPLLALYRESAQHDEFTLQRERITTRWGCDYILGPLTPADFRRLGATLNAARLILSLVIRKRGHPAFDAGALQFGAGNGDFSTIRIVESQEGPATFGEQGEGLEFHAIHVTLETTELDSLVDGDATDFEGVSVSLGLGGGEGVLPDALAFRTEVPLEPNHGKP